MLGGREGRYWGLYINNIVVDRSRGRGGGAHLKIICRIPFLDRAFLAKFLLFPLFSTHIFFVMNVY